MCTHIWRFLLQTIKIEVCVCKYVQNNQGRKTEMGSVNIYIIFLLEKGV